MKIHRQHGGESSHPIHATYGKPTKMSKQVSTVAQKHMLHQSLVASKAEQKAFREYEITYPAAKKHKKG